MSYFGLAFGFSFPLKSGGLTNAEQAAFPARPPALTLRRGDAERTRTVPRATAASPRRAAAPRAMVLPWKHLPPNNTAISTRPKGSPALIAC